MKTAVRVLMSAMSMIFSTAASAEDHPVPECKQGPFKYRYLVSMHDIIPSPPSQPQSPAPQNPEAQIPRQDPHQEIIALKPRLKTSSSYTIDDGLRDLQASIFMTKDHPAVVLRAAQENLVAKASSEPRQAHIFVEPNDIEAANDRIKAVTDELVEQVNSLERFTVSSVELSGGIIAFHLESIPPLSIDEDFASAEAKYWQKLKAELQPIANLEEVKWACSFLPDREVLPAYGISPDKIYSSSPEAPIAISPSIYQSVYLGQSTDAGQGHPHLVYESAHWGKASHYPDN